MSEKDLRLDKELRALGATIRTKTARPAHRDAVARVALSAFSNAEIAEPKRRKSWLRPVPVVLGVIAAVELTILAFTLNSRVALRTSDDIARVADDDSAVIAMVAENVDAELGLAFEEFGDVFSDSFALSAEGDEDPFDTQIELPTDDALTFELSDFDNMEDSNENEYDEILS